MLALHTLGHVSELRARVHAFEARQRLLGPEAFVVALEELVRSPGRTDAMLACALSLVDAPAGLHAAAVRAKLPFASLLLADAPPHRALARLGRLPEGDRGDGTFVQHDVHLHRPMSYAPPSSGQYPWDEDAPADDLEPEPWRRPCTLPDWHWVVRGQITRLARQPSPRLIRRVLHDRATRPNDLVAIATRRPTTEPIVRELLAHAPTIDRVAVRTAIVANPFTPTRIALLLVPSCRPNLRTIARANVHPAVQALASLLA